MSLFAFDDKKDHTPALEKYLLAKGGNLSILDNDGRNPLFYLFFKQAKPKEGGSCDPASILMTLLKSETLKKKDYN